MTKYMPFIYGGAAVIFVIRGMARGLFGTAAQSYYNEAFVGTPAASGEDSA